MAAMVEQPERRRHWSESEARRWVEEHEASGLTIAAFAQAHGINAKRLTRWRGRLEVRARLMARHGRMGQQSVAAPSVRIARVEREVAPGQEPAVSTSAVLTIEVGGARALVPAGFDAQTVRVVVEALLGASGGGK